MGIVKILLAKQKEYTNFWLTMPPPTHWTPCSWCIVLSTSNSCCSNTYTQEEVHHLSHDPISHVHSWLHSKVYNDSRNLRICLGFQWCQWCPVSISWLSMGTLIAVKNAIQATTGKPDGFSYVEYRPPPSLEILSTECFGFEIHTFGMFRAVYMIMAYLF